MSNLVRGSVIAVLMLISISLLAIYYTQPFKENFTFKDSISYSEIEVEKSPQNSYYDYTTQTYISSDKYILQYAKAVVGTLKIENEGVFPQIYVLPQVIGCIDLKDSVDKNSVLLNQNQFTINYRTDGTSYYAGQKIELKTGEKKSINLEGIYNSYNLPVSEFSKENIKGVSIFVLDNKEENPVSPEIDYKYYGYNYYGDCNTLRQENTPDAVILIN